MNKKNRILIVDDEEKIRIILRMLLEKEGYEVIDADSGNEAIKICGKNQFDVVLLDMNMPLLNGLETMQKLKVLQKHAQYVFITAHGTIKHAVQAMKDGAYNFVSKPFDNNEILAILNGAVRVVELNRKLSALESQIYEDDPFREIIGSSKAIKDTCNLAEKVANTELSVLVQGSSGVGKELIVRAIHRISSRRNRKFIAVNCAAIPKDLFESEFFGHEKGAFTGAITNHNGKFIEADGGTLFLDEIGEMPLEFQAKLLRVLENGEVYKIGTSDPQHVDVRVISATNKSLKDKVKSGDFREDLYYRLNNFELVVPDLKDRREDIPELARYLLKKKYPEKSINDDTLKKMMLFDWPGNIRQLKSEINRAAVLSDDVINPETFSFSVKPELECVIDLSGEIDLEAVLNDIRGKYITQAILKAKGNKKRAAELLGLSYRVFNYQYEKLSKNE